MLSSKDRVASHGGLLPVVGWGLGRQASKDEFPRMVADGGQRFAGHVVTIGGTQREPGPEGAVAQCRQEFFDVHVAHESTASDLDRLGDHERLAIGAREQLIGFIIPHELLGLGIDGQDPSQLVGVLVQLDVDGLQIFADRLE